MAIDIDAPLRFLRTAFEPDDWVAILLKNHQTGGSAQRVGPMTLVASPPFQAWLRAENARRFSVFVSVNAIRPQRKARTRDAIGPVRHVFLDVDRDGTQVLSAIAAHRGMPAPSCVVQSSPERVHILWRVTGFDKPHIEGVQKELAQRFGTDKAATSCAQLTRLPGFFNHKYRPAPVVTARYATRPVRLSPATFPPAPGRRVLPMSESRPASLVPASPGAQERARRYLAAIPAAVAGQHGDEATFRVCCRLVRGFALNDEEALGVLREWNQGCAPPWSEAELRAKLQGARRYGREAIGGLL